MSDGVETKEAEFDEDIFDSMLHGTFEEPTEEVEDTEDDTDDDNEDEQEDQEDTDQEDESEEEEELDEDDDGDPGEDSEDEDEDEGEDSLVEDDDSDDEDDDIEDEEEDSDDEEESEDEDIGEESEDSTETEENSDGDAPETDEVDYKAFYEAVVNTEFKVNGKTVKGFTDPQKIIQSQQMAGGFSEKMAGFKQYRPYMAPLKDRGMLDDPAKFDLAMNLIDGDAEAIKAHLKTLEIDPIDLDMEAINYSGKAAVASNQAMILEDVMERAKSAGIEDKVTQIVGKDWDAESFQEFVSNDAVRNDLLSHIESGAYDAVQDKMSELSRLDYSGQYSSMNTIGKYRQAVQELQREYSNNTQAASEAPEAPVAKKTVAKKPSVKSEKAKIVKARKEEEYKQKAAKQEAKLTQQRKRAASMSKKKPKAKPKAKFDPMALEGEEFDAHMDFLISGGR